VQDESTSTMSSIARKLLWTPPAWKPISDTTLLETSSSSRFRVKFSDMPKNVGLDNTDTHLRPMCLVIRTRYFFFFLELLDAVLIVASRVICWTLNWLSSISFALSKLWLSNCCDSPKHKEPNSCSMSKTSGSMLITEQSLSKCLGSYRLYTFLTNL
jgi:hypothetical protein